MLTETVIVAWLPVSTWIDEGSAESQFGTERLRSARSYCWIVIAASNGSLPWLRTVSSTSPELPSLPESSTSDGVTPMVTSARTGAAEKAAPIASDSTKTHTVLI